MPVTRVHCAARAGKGSFEVLPLQACLDCAASGVNPCQMTAPMVRYVHGSWKDSAGRNPYSASRVSGCPRRTVLEQRLDWGADPMNAYSAMRGTMVHSSLSELISPECGEVGEIRVSRDFMGVTIGGQFDYLQLKTGILYDYKTVGRVPPFQYAYVKHKVQMNVYRWLLQGQSIPDGLGGETKVDIKKLLVQYIAGDAWKQCTAIFMDFSEIESIIAKFVNAVKPALDAGDSWHTFLPEVLPYDSWDCQYCELKSACYTLKDQQLLTQSMED